MVKDNLTIKPLDLSMKIMAPIDVGKIMVGAICGVVFSFLPYSSTFVLGIVKAVSYQLHNYINRVCVVNIHAALWRMALRLISYFEQKERRGEVS